MSIIKRILRTGGQRLRGGDAADVATNTKRSLVWLQVLIVAITLIAVAVVIFLDRQTYRETEKMATEQFNQQQLILARSAARGIETFVNSAVDDLLALSELPSVQRMEPDILEEMRSMFIGFPPETSSRRLDKNGILRFIYPDEGWREGLIGRGYSEEAYFQKAKETEEVVISDLVINEVGEKRIRVVRPVYIEGEKGVREFNGVIVVSFDIEELSRLYISPIVSGKTGYAWLLNEEGIFLAHHDEEFVSRNAFEVRAERNPDISYEAINQIQRRMMAGEEGVGRYVSGWHREQIGEIEKLVAYTPVHIDDHIWSVAVCAPVSEVEQIVQTTKRSKQNTLRFVILALVTGGLSLFITSLRWSRSLEQEVARQTRELRETITERKRAEEALRESEEKFRSISDTATEAIVSTDNRGNIMYWNQAAQAMFGYRPDEVIGKPVTVTIPERRRERFEDGLRKIISIGDTSFVGKTFEGSGLRKDGSEFPTEFSLATWESKGARFFTAVVRDITERKQAEEELRRTLEKLREALGGIIQTVASTVEVKDPYTAGHQRRVGNLACAIANEMGLPQEQIDGIRMAGLIHDLGKVGIPAEILSKPGRLNEFELGMIKAHSQIGYDILKKIEFPWPVAQIVLQHHERLDGSGYPRGLSGEEIMLEARILAVADVVEAMASRRPYRPPRGLDKALEEISQNRGVLYDPEVVDACLKLFTEKGFEFE